MACRLAGMVHVLPYPKKKVNCTRKIPAPTTISNSRTRTVPRVPKYYRRHCFNFRVLQIRIWTGSFKLAKNIQSDNNNIQMLPCNWGGFKSERKCYKSSLFAKTMNLSQSFTYLNICFLLCFSSITFSAVEILWNVRI